MNDAEFSNFKRQLFIKLDEIIGLLEFDKSIYQARDELKVGNYAVKCTCDKKGKTSAVEICPMHDLPLTGA